MNQLTTCSQLNVSYTPTLSISSLVGSINKFPQKIATSAPFSQRSLDNA